MKHRNLRITWSVLCGIIGAALMLLLICSFEQHDALTTRTGDTIAESWRGRLGLNVPPLDAFNFHWQLVHESTADRVVRLDETQLPVNPPYFQFYRLAGRPGIVGPLRPRSATGVAQSRPAGGGSYQRMVTCPPVRRNTS